MEPKTLTTPLDARSSRLLTRPNEYLRPNLSNFQKFQREDPDISPLFSYCEPNFRGTWPSKNPLEPKELKTINGVLHYIDPDENVRAIVPSKLVDSVLWKLHTGPGRIHNGRDSMEAEVDSDYFWPGYKTSIRKFLKECRTCNSIKTAVPRPKPNAPIERGSSPWEVIHIDLLGPLKTTRTGNKYVCVIVDSFSKFAIMTPLKDKTTWSVIDVLSERVFPIFGICKVMRSDNGLEFASNSMTKFLEAWGVIQQFNVAYSPHQNGKAERLNGTLMIMLRAILKSYTNHEWDKALSAVNFAYNARISRLTMTSPFEVIFGRSGRVPEKFYQGVQCPANASYSTEAFLEYSIPERAFRWQQVNERLSQFEPKFAPSEPEKRHKITVGSFVFLRSVKTTDKLSKAHQGPYLVEKLIGSCTFMLRCPSTGKTLKAGLHRVVRASTALLSEPADMPKPYPTYDSTTKMAFDDNEPSELTTRLLEAQRNALLNQSTPIEAEVGIDASSSTTHRRGNHCAPGTTYSTQRGRQLVYPNYKK